MAIKVAWDNAQQTAIRLVLGDNWTWEEFDAAREQVQLLCGNVPHAVDIVLDIFTSITVSPQIFAQLHSLNTDAAASSQALLSSKETHLINKHLKLQSFSPPHKSRS